MTVRAAIALPLISAVLPSKPQSRQQGGGEKAVKKTPTAASAAPGHRKTGKVGGRAVQTGRESGGGGFSAPSDKGASPVACICARGWHLIE